MRVTEADIQAFVEFARMQTAEGEAVQTMAELATKWEAEREQVNCAIAESLSDIETGRTTPFFESQDRFRRDRQLPPNK